MKKHVTRLLLLAVVWGTCGGVLGLYRIYYFNSLYWIVFLLMALSFIIGNADGIKYRAKCFKVKQDIKKKIFQYLIRDDDTTETKKVIEVLEEIKNKLEQM